jgi:hypothetical protein
LLVAENRLYYRRIQMDKKYSADHFFLL